MKPTPPDLAAAIRAASRHVHSRVRLWPAGLRAEPVDITHLVDTVKASRELSGQLPDDVRLVEGAGTGKTDLTLSGTGSLNTAQVWSRDSAAGPLGEADRLAVPITVDIGVTVAGRGIGWCRVFSGTVRAISIDGATAATLTALDARDAARNPVTYPPVADHFAGLTLHWCVAYAAHAAGFDAQPSPARLHPTDPARGWWPLAYWPMCGGHAPFIAAPGSHASTVAAFVEPHQDDTDPQTGGIDVVDGPLRQPAAAAYYTGRRRWRHITGAADTHTPDGLDNPPPMVNLRLETWVKDDPATTRAPGDLVRLAVSGDGGAALILTKAGRAVISMPRRGSGQNSRPEARFVAPPLDSLGWKPGAWNHFGAHITTDGTGHPVITWRVNGTATTLAYPMRVSLGRASRAHIAAWLPVAGAAISRTPAEAPWLDGNGWTATAVITGAGSRLLWPGEFGAKTCWEHLTDIATATGSAVHFDTTGRLTFTGPPAQARAPVVEVTTRSRVTALAVEDSLDRVRNVVSVPEHGGTVKAPGDEPLWSDDASVKIDPGDTLELVAEFADPCVNTDTTLAITATPQRGQSWAYLDYRKQPKPGDTRPVPARLIDAQLADVTGTGATARITNRSGSPVWLTPPPAADSRDQVPAIGVCGWWVKPATTTHRRRDTPSINTYGAFPYDDAETPWRQSGGAQRADRLLADLSHPHTVITGISIIGDPRLAIGDVISIRDPDGTRLAGAWAITGISDDHTPSGGYTQTLTVHPAPPPTR